jgi:hypothetical protein
LKAPETRRQWPARLKQFFDFGINPKLDLQKQAEIFYEKASSNEKWAVLYIEKFIEFQKERVVKREIESTTIRNYYKAAKLFCDMNDITLNWKRLSKGLPKQKQASDDRAPTIEEIKKLMDYPDKRIKPILLTMLSSGIRKEAWEYLKWKHIVPIFSDHDNTIIIAAKIIVYAGDNEEYFSFITPEAYISLKEWIEFRAFHGEGISGNSWVMRNLFIVSERTWKRDPNHSNYLGDINDPVQLSSDGIKSMIERAIHAQGLWSPLKEGSRRREWKGMHGFRKFFKTQAEHSGMKSLHVEMMLGHNTGLAKNYYRPSERELLEEYIKAVDDLTIKEENRLSKQVQELKTRNKDSEYVIKGKLQEKEEQIKNLEESVKFLSDRFNAFLISQPHNKIVYDDDAKIKGITLKPEINNKAVGQVKINPSNGNNKKK